MNDTIRRQAAIKEIARWKGYLDDDMISRIQVGLNKLPSAQPERKKGKWIERECGTEDKAEGWLTVVVCSCCDFPATTFYSEDCESRTQIRTDFCPNCGADMRGGKDE